MKRIIAIVLVSIVALLGAVAKESNMKVMGNVPEIPFSTQLTYDGIAMAETEFDVFEDGVGGSARWNLTEAGQTKVFALNFKGNQRETHKVTINMSASDFTDGADGHTTQTVYIDNITTTSKKERYDGKTGWTQSRAIASGMYNKWTYGIAFRLYWDGDATMDAGDYASTVTVTYAAV